VSARDAGPSPEQRRLGSRLRDIRHQQGLSLAQVQARSGGRWKAVVVGAYERGDRSITIGRLEELARFYGVPVADLITPPGTATRSAAASRDGSGDRSVTRGRPGDAAADRPTAAAGAREGTPYGAGGGTPDGAAHRTPADPPAADPAGGDPADEEPRAVLDLTQLDPDDPRIAPVVRFVDRVRRRRGDHNGRVLTLRRDDLALVALATGTDLLDLRDDLAERGVLRTGP
jgi:transcriptional regulator with XRE-family HTH domain